MNIIFYCPCASKPTGGIRAIYDFCNVLKNNGFKAFIFHPISSYRYKYTNKDISIYKGKYSKKGDHFVIPDVYVARPEFLSLYNNSNYSLLIQNPYIISALNRFSDIDIINKAFKNASKILVISEDAKSLILKQFPSALKKIIVLGWSMNCMQFSSFDFLEKEKIITYMPRKNIDHIRLVLNTTINRLPEPWKFVPLKNLSYQELIKLLQKSSIFLSFGSFEGLPAPPVEAALAGNIVVGYHGNGGKEYWEEPNFHQINPCDISSFSDKIVSITKSIDENHRLHDDLFPVIDKLSYKFSVSKEYEKLEIFMDFLNKQNDLENYKSIRLPLKFNFFTNFLDKLITKKYQINIL